MIGITGKLSCFEDDLFLIPQTPSPCLYLNGFTAQHIWLLVPNYGNADYIIVSITILYSNAVVKPKDGYSGCMASVCRNI